MEKLTAYDREELAFIKWEMSGGPERQAKKDIAGMDSVLADAEEKGWEVLKRWADMDGWGGKCEHVVLMKGDEIVRASFNSFNQGLMKKLESGGSCSWTAS
tara:strand:+ start:698 stop:1000 length:303 start_codon:yes stop_codon:yes gene_type:complete